MTSAGKELATGRISEVGARGSTNLSGGLLKGIEQQVNAANAYKAGGSQGEGVPVVHAVLLLTDGEANEGITDAYGIEQAMDESLGTLESSSRVRVFTFGYGRSHNAELLSALAEAASGSYFFVEDDDTLPVAFGSVLGGLLATNCQNVEVKLQAKSGATIDASAGSLAKSKADDDGVVTLPVGDLFAEERRDLIIEIVPAASDPIKEQPLLVATVR